ncbi:o-succinylbenzoate synthase [Gulosibacter faecalis]|jgi:O-succinylbenzoate synthase|uniref:O-succinylbenzoate synthase n=1 Tax=Gulosibacter faecalis TaxID=272240 RepID=A0ABW5UWW6_9MICO|nr:o-succinylbenzoate synthase [Gulosibacter faecalis]
MTAAALVPIDDLLARTHVVSLPLNTRFRGVTHREAALIEGDQTVDGVPVWSEFSPFFEYETAEAANWLAAALEYAFAPDLDRFAAGTVPVNATVPAVEAAAVPAVLARYDGCEVVKVKVAERGQRLADDLARLEAVRAAAPDARLRIDANAGWSVAEAARALTAFADAGFEFEYAEQPVGTVTELAALRRELAGRPAAGIRLAADELVRKADDPLAVARSGTVDHLVVKAQPLGGVRRATAIVRESGLTATVSSALDTSVGIVMGAQLAAGLAKAGLPVFAAGLGTVSLFADEVSEPRRPVGGRISLAPVVPDAAALREHAATPDRVAWWHARIRACHAVLAG